MKDSDSEDFDLNDTSRRAEKAEDRYPRALGSPSPIGIRGAIPPTPVQFGRPHPAPVPPPHALTTPSAPSGEPRSTLQRAVSVFRAAMPFVQRVLPLLDGNVGTAVSNILAPRPQTLPPVDIAPIQNGLTSLQSQHRELRNQIVEQNASLKKVEDQLKMVREATDRNTLEQQELLGDLKSVGKKINLFACFALSLLALSLALNVILVLHFWRILH